MLLWFSAIQRCFVIFLLLRLTGAVKEVTTLEQFHALLSEASGQGRPVILEYVSSTCLKCTALEPVFQKIAKEFAGRAFFRKVDSKQSPQIAAESHVQDQPTFHFWLSGRKHHELTGDIVDEAALRDASRRVVEEADRTDAASGRKGSNSAPAPAAPEVVKAVVEPQELSTLLSKVAEKPVIVEYLSPTCVTCAMLKPFFHALAKEFAERAHFRVVDTKQNPKSASDYGVQVMPTFQFWLRGRKFHQLPGDDANKDSLREWVQRIVDQADREQGPSEATPAPVATPAPTPPATIAPAPAPEPRNRPPCRDKPRLRGTRPCKPLEGDRRKKGATANSTSSAATKIDLRGVSLEELRQEVQQREASAELIEPAYNPCVWYRHRKPDATEKVVIVGGGPAGMAAAIYAARANLCPLVFAPAFGGQLSSKGVDVENYPGVPQANGAQMVKVMKQQALSFLAEVRDDSVLSVNTSAHPLEISTHSSGLLKAHTLIWATGADSRWLHVEGEDEYKGHGVSGCAACDGFLYKGKKCAVIGGGDSAMEEALMLARLCSEVTIVHRRDKFRASPLLQKRVLDNPKVDVRWNSEVARFVGETTNREGEVHKALTHLELRNTLSPQSVPVELIVDAAFVAVGHDPNTKLLQGQVRMDQHNYIGTSERSTRTSVPGVFAAGDVADHIYRQAITSAGSGAMAALDAHLYLAENPVEEEDCWQAMKQEVHDIEF